MYLVEINLIFLPSFRWTGSNSNPGNNAGQGQAGTDRHNIVELVTQRYDGLETSNVKGGHWANNYPAKLEASDLLGLDFEDRENLAFSGMSKNSDKFRKF